MDNWTTPKYKHAPRQSLFGGSQFTRCIPLSKREAKIKNQAGFFVFDKFRLLVNLGEYKKSGLIFYFGLSFRACLHGDGGPQVGEVTL